MTEEKKQRFEGMNRTPRAKNTREKENRRKPWAPPQCWMLHLRQRGTSIVGYVQKFAVLMTVKIFLQKCDKVMSLSVETNIPILKPL